MSKRDVLGLLVAGTGGLLSTGKGELLGIALLLVGVYILAEPRLASKRGETTGRGREFAR